LLHQLTVAIYFIFPAKYQLDDLFRISQIKAEYDKTMITGARVIRLKSNMSSLNLPGSTEPPPLISINPKISKLMINSKIRYFLFVKTIVFYSCTRKKQKVQIFAKKTVKEFVMKLSYCLNSDERIKNI